MTSQKETRTPQDYAIEHGEYLAKAVECFLKALNERDKAREEADGPDEIMNADDVLTDHFQAVKSAVYEFRKRAKRAEAGCDSAQESAPEEWISVEERLPEKSDEYLVVEDGDVFAADFFVSLEHIRQSKWMTVRSYGVDCEEQELYSVTHWMPLPKPPEHAKKGK